MDDFKNNGIAPDAESENVSDVAADMPENTDVPEETTQSVQAEETAGIPITEPETDGNESDGPEMCILCEEKPADKSFGEHYDLCADCRKALIKSPLRFKGFLALVAMLVFSVWGLSFLGMQAGVIEAVDNGYKLIEENKPESAIAGIAQITDMGWKTARKLAMVCFDMGSVDDASYLISNYFYDAKAATEEQPLTWADKVGKGNLNAPWNKKLKETSDFLEYIDGYANKHSELFYKYYEDLYYGEITEKEIPYDDIIAQYEQSLAKAENDTEKGIINYYMLATSSVCKKDIKVQLKYCAAVKDLIPECQWLYIDNLITLSIRTGDYATAEEFILKLSETDPESIYPKRYSAISLRYQGKYDEAMALIEEIIADIEVNQFFDIYYDALVCEFLAGDYESAYEYASLCFNDQFYLTPDSVNFYALLSKKLGKDSGYDAAAEMLAQYDMKISPLVDKFISGEITVDQLFKNGEVTFE